MLAAVLISQLGATGAAAVCTRRDWAAFERGHRDLGEGRVFWHWSWNAEGVADDFIVLDCAGRTGLSARARSERMSETLPYDRRDRARRVIETHVSAPHFFRFDRLAEALDDIRVPSLRLAPDTEPCACAAFYPGRWDGTDTTGDE